LVYGIIAVDPKSEEGTCKTLQELHGELTTFAISHQTALVEATDRVYRLRDGIITLITDWLVVNVSPGESKRDSNPNSSEWTKDSEILLNLPLVDI